MHVRVKMDDSGASLRVRARWMRDGLEILFSSVCRPSVLWLVCVLVRVW